MVSQNVSEWGLRPQSVKTPLQLELKKVSEKCTMCGTCQRDCEFLKKYGTPKEIADTYDPSDRVCQAMLFDAVNITEASAGTTKSFEKGGYTDEGKRKDFSKHGGDEQT